MKVNGKELDVNELTKEVYRESSITKMRGKGIYLSDDDIAILEKYNINYKNYNSLSNLIFGIEEILNEEDLLPDLEEVCEKLSELNYYNNTNK